MKSKIALLHPIIIFSVGCALILLGISLCIYFFIAHSINDEAGLVIGGVLLCMIGLGMIVVAMITSYFININPNSITIKTGFSKQVISFEEIQSINLLVNGIDCLRTEIVTENKKFHFSDWHYRNTPEIKIYLYSTFSSKIVSTLKAIDINGYSSTRKKAVFSNNPFLCFDGILFLFVGSWSFILFLVMHHTIDFTEIALTLCLLLVTSTAAGRNMFYFTFKNNKLIIKNHFWLWYRKKYQIEDILAIDYHYSGRGDSLIVITKDYHNKTYGSSSLFKRTWRDLFSYFAQLNIPEVGWSVSLLFKTN